MDKPSAGFGGHGCPPVRKQLQINLTTRKKIVYLIGTLAVGGAERQLVETAIRLDRTRFDARIYAISSGGPLKAYAEQAGIPVTAHEAKRCGVLAYARKFLALCSYLRRERPDIVHCFMFTPSLYGGCAAKLTGRPIVITSRRNLGLFKDGAVHYQWFENFVNRFTDLVIVNSRAVLSDTLQRERIAADKVEVIYNGIDTCRYAPGDRHDPQVARLKAQLGISEADVVIGMIANLYRYKGHHELLTAAAEVIRECPNTFVLCVGEEREGLLPELRNLCTRHGIQDYVRFAGFVSDIPNILKMMDIIVSASYEEGFSNVILEAMAAGKPVIATSVGGNPEAVLDGETGRLVPAHDAQALAAAILDLAQHPEQIARYGRNARMRVEAHFSMETMIHRIEQTYDHLLRGKA